MDIYDCLVSLSKSTSAVSVAVFWVVVGGWNWFFGWLWVVVDGCGWFWMVVDGCGWFWMVVGGCGWLRVVVDGFGWLWLVLDGCGG